MIAEPISVVVPCYNGMPYVIPAVQSVLAQDWPGIEVIVIDDGSGDGSAVRVEQACPGVRVVRQPHAGVAAARNRGIEEATGDWIAFLDADDIWLPGKLRAQFELLRERPDARMVYSAWRVWPSAAPAPDADTIRRTLEDVDPRRWAGPSGWIYGALLLDCEVWTSTVVAHRSLFDEVGRFDTALSIGEDYDLWLRASRVTPILRVPRPLALYRMHPTSVTRSPPPRNWRALVVSRAVERWGYACEHRSVARPREVRRALAASWRHHAAAHLAAGSLPTACRAAAVALRSDPCQAATWRVLVRALLSWLAFARPPRYGSH